MLAITVVSRSSSKTTSFPVNFSSFRSYVLDLSNLGSSDAQVECKIIKGNRAPGKIITLSKLSSRIIFLKDVFSEILNELSDKNVQAYLKLNAISKDAKIGAQILDYAEGANEGEFSSLV